jgi:hypothetical protein
MAEWSYSRKSKVLPVSPGGMSTWQQPTPAQRPSLALAELLQ